MASDPPENYSFWERATPRQGARALVEMYGESAAPVLARHHAEAARAAGRPADHRFWTAVLARLRAQAPLNERLRPPGSPDPPASPSPARSARRPLPRGEG